MSTRPAALMRSGSRRAAAPLATLALTGALLAGCMTGSGATGSPGAPTAGPASRPGPTVQLPTPPPTPSPAPTSGAGDEWQMVGDLPGDDPGAIAAGAGAWVAVGIPSLPGGQETVLVSRDGVSWTLDSQVTGLPYAVPCAVAYGHGGWVIVGRSFTETSSFARHEAAAWRSTDLRTWTAAPFTADLDLGGLNLDLPFEGMQDVVADGTGYVAVGNDARGAAAWTSPDGLAWERAADPADAAGASMAAVVRLDDGTLVAVGHGWTEAGATEARAWSSADGRGWTVEPVDAPGVLVDAATDGTTVLAVPANDQVYRDGPALDPPLVARSPGGTWAAAGGAALAGVRVATVASNGTRWILFGSREVATAVRGDAAWASDDGVTWAPVLGFADPFPTDAPSAPRRAHGVTAVATDGARFVAVGALLDEDPMLGPSAAWISPPVEP